MNKIEHCITIDVAHPETQLNTLSFSLVKGDTANRIRVSVMNDGTPYELPKGIVEGTPVWFATKPDGTVIYNICSYGENQIVYDLTTADTSSVGLVKAELRVYSAPFDKVPLAYDSSVNYTIGDYCIHDNNFYICKNSTTGTWDSSDWNVVKMTLLITPRILINVVDSAGSDSAVESTDQYTALTQAMAQAGAVALMMPANLIPSDSAPVTVNTVWGGKIVRCRGVYTAAGVADNDPELATISQSFTLTSGTYRFCIFGDTTNFSVKVRDGVNLVVAEIEDGTMHEFTVSESTTCHLAIDVIGKLGAFNSCFYPIIDKIST